jgi:hypothetical protein
MAFGGLQGGLFPPVFWQTKRETGVFSTGNKRRQFTGFSGIDRMIKNGKGARTGVI